MTTHTYVCVWRITHVCVAHSHTHVWCATLTHMCDAPHTHMCDAPHSHMCVCVAHVYTNRDIASRSVRQPIQLRFTTFILQQLVYTGRTGTYRAHSGVHRHTAVYGRMSRISCMSAMVYGRMWRISCMTGTYSLHISFAWLGSEENLLFQPFGVCERSEAQELVQ